MATQPPADTAGEARPQLPLFYRSPEPLSSARHGDWRLKQGDLAFAAETAFVPIVVGELAAAARNYPIVFAADNSQPIAVLGLEARNLFVTEGRWAEDGYLPAYVRRYPFAFIATTNPDGFALAIDTASDRVAQGGTEGEPLFADGQPTELTKQALGFCDAFQGEATATRAFAEALASNELLVDRRADATLPDGRRLGLDGFRVVDAEKFAQLPDELVVEWHRKGWLALVHFHLLSLERFSALLNRQSALQPAKAQEEVA
ncbi:SapC family protein [Sandaracinobacter sp. RS1-74]|uniref:SapC family protein n=1 Tax=Sandaracinobacteroides sayramensis TaxID=2913411 RepID=UPI001EDA4A8E|nr:SapC family protein [Sandaracinobacteroides sayramensis]MCG2840697.1 SapC family protein [Sandaracinobacteroides sayramensis]